MAVAIIRTDDLTGQPDATPVVITVNGTGVEIDLAPSSLDRLREALAPYWTAGREAGYDVAPRQGRTSRRKLDHADADYDTAAVRQWAANNGIHVAARGRVPRDVVDRYQASS